MSGLTKQAIDRLAEIDIAPDAKGNELRPQIVKCLRLIDARLDEIESNALQLSLSSATMLTDLKRRVGWLEECEQEVGNG